MQTLIAWLSFLLGMVGITGVTLMAGDYFHWILLALVAFGIWTIISTHRRQPIGEPIPTLKESSTTGTAPVLPETKDQHQTSGGELVEEKPPAPVPKPERTIFFAFFSALNLLALPAMVWLFKNYFTFGGIPPTDLGILPDVNPATIGLVVFVWWALTDIGVIANMTSRTNASLLSAALSAFTALAMLMLLVEAFTEVTASRAANIERALVVGAFFANAATMSLVKWLRWAALPVAQEAKREEAKLATVSALPRPRNETVSESSSKGSPIMSTSNHPLAGHTGAFFGLVSIIVDALIGTGLFWVLAGWVKPPTPNIVLFGLAYPWELVAVAAAFGYFILSGIFSVRRERSPGWAVTDFLGVIGVGVVLIGAALSFHPMVGAFYQKFGVPAVAYTPLNMTILVSFGIAIVIYFKVFHLRRAQVGLEGIQQGSRPTVQSDAQVVGVSSLNLAELLAALPNGLAIMPIKDDQTLTYMPKQPTTRLSSVA